MRDLILKIAAWVLLVFSSLFSLVVLSGIFFISMFSETQEFNMAKVAIIDFGIIIVAFLIFILGLGCFEFILSFIKVKEDLEKVEEELEYLEKGSTREHSSDKSHTQKEGDLK